MGRGSKVGEITALNKELDDILATQKGDLAKNFIRETTSFARDPEKYLTDTLSNIPNIIATKLGEAFSGLGGIISKSLGFGGEENKKTPKLGNFGDFWIEKTSENTNQLQQLNNNIQGLNNTIQKAQPSINQLQKGIK
jgi:hypothetical protein